MSKQIERQAAGFAKHLFSLGISRGVENERT